MESPSITAKYVSETLSVSPRTIERYLSVLKKLGVLSREDRDDDSIWVLIEV
ncbi:MAG: HTH domain-containing protein [Prevotella sp.]|nr:HTH domain-containing protein [Candidatus Equicola faecalis]